MFTGIVQDLGYLEARVPHNGGMDFCIATPALAPSLKAGDSVACNGVCLTVTALEAPVFRVHAVPETLSKTNLGRLDPGARINLELAVSTASFLGGHFVLGHVDGLCEVTAFDALPDGSRLLRARIPEDFSIYCVHKGSIALNGVSLTLARVDGCTLEIALIPHTLQVTNLGTVKLGEALNFEVDMMAKYVERFVAAFAERMVSSALEARLPRSGAPSSAAGLPPA